MSPRVTQDERTKRQKAFRWGLLVFALTVAAVAAGKFKKPTVVESAGQAAPVSKSGPSLKTPEPVIPLAERVRKAVDRVTELAKQSPDQAANFAATQGDPEVQREAVRQAIIAWAAQDHVAAWEWTKTALPPGESRDDLQTTLAYQAVPADPKLALTIAGTLPPSKERDQLLNHAAMEWSTTEPNEAIAWADQISDVALNTSIISAIATAVATKHPKEAAELAISLPQGPEQDRTAVAVAQRWAQQDYAAAHAWVSVFPNPSTREAALAALVPFAPVPPPQSLE